MKASRFIFLAWLAPLILQAESPAPVPTPKDKETAEKIAEHQKAAAELSDRQDNLAADVQQLTIEQTNAQVAELLKSVEYAMDDASERLLDHDTGSETLAAQTDVIEKIHEAAKKRQQQSGNSDSSAGGALMDMMERMMGKEPGQKQGEGNKPAESNQGGQGQTGDSDTANNNDQGAARGGEKEPRRVPKASGSAGASLPSEFQGVLDAYNRAAGKLAK